MATVVDDYLQASLFHTICDRITHEIEGINRVFMDITPKPIGTIEFV